MKINYQECGGWFWPETSTLKPIDANFTWKNFKNDRNQKNCNSCKINIKLKNYQAKVSAFFCYSFQVVFSFYKFYKKTQNFFEIFFLNSLQMNRIFDENVNETNLLLFTILIKLNSENQLFEF